MKIPHYGEVYMASSKTNKKPKHKQTTTQHVSVPLGIFKSTWDILELYTQVHNSCKASILYFKNMPLKENGRKNS